MADWHEDLISTAPDPDTAERVQRAVDQLLRRDANLFDMDVNERSISHRLAIYLEEQFPDWDVDCEYNRNGHDPKRLRLTPDMIESDDEQGTSVYPDIIVHRRGKPENFLAIEIKKHNGGGKENDLLKLRALRKELGYAHALFVRFQTAGPKPGVMELQWIIR